MKFWRRREPDKAPDRAPDIDPSLQERVAALEDIVGDLSAKLESIDYEWTDWYDKFRRLHARIAKRIEREPEPGDTSSADGESPNGITNPLALKLLGRS